MPSGNIKTSNNNHKYCKQMHWQNVFSGSLEHCSSFAHSTKITRTVPNMKWSSNEQLPIADITYWFLRNQLQFVIDILHIHTLLLNQMFIIYFWSVISNFIHWNIYCNCLSGNCSASYASLRSSHKFKQVLEPIAARLCGITIQQLIKHHNGGGLCQKL